MKPTKMGIEKRLAEQEKRRPRLKRLPIIEYHYPLGATPEEMDALAAAAKEKFLADHPECDPYRPTICLGLPQEDINLEVET